MANIYTYTITLTKRPEDGSIKATGVSNIPIEGLPVGDSVQVSVFSGSPSLANPVILTLCVYNTNSAMTTPQKGALVATWGLFQGTTGMYSSAGLIPLFVGPATSAGSVTFTNINQGTSGEISFFGVGGTVEDGSTTVSGWCHDPEVQLLGGQM